MPSGTGSSRKGRILLFVLIALVGLTLVCWFAIPESGRRLLLTAVGADDYAVRIEASGKVLDIGGQPVVGASVRGEWRAIGQGSATSTGHGTFDAVTRSDGSYWQVCVYTTSLLEQAAAIQVNLTMQAHGPFADRVPSEPFSATVPGRSSVTRDFQLGAMLPTVPVHVADSAGAPVEQFWVTADPVDPTAAAAEPRPHRYKDFPGGIATLPVPSWPFRVRVHLYRGEREATVGPFDPLKLPERIDVVLPDR